MLRRLGKCKEWLVKGNSQFLAGPGEMGQFSADISSLVTKAIQNCCVQVKNKLNERDVHCAFVIGLLAQTHRVRQLLSPRH